MRKLKEKLNPAVRKKLRTWHHVSGSTLEYLALGSGASASQICEFENGAGTLPPEKVRKLEKILRRSLLARARKISQLLAAELPVRKPFGLGRAARADEGTLEPPAPNAKGGQRNA